MHCKHRHYFRLKNDQALIIDNDEKDKTLIRNNDYIIIHCWNDVVNGDRGLYLTFDFEDELNLRRQRSLAWSNILCCRQKVNIFSWKKFGCRIDSKESSKSNHAISNFSEIAFLLHTLKNQGSILIEKFLGPINGLMRVESTLP